MTFALRLAATLLFLLLFASTALAQSVTITRTERDDLEPGRDLYSINQANCGENGNIEVTLNVMNPGDAQLEVWAGTSSGNCATDTNRNLANSTQCRRVLSEEATANVTVSFTVQGLLPVPPEGGNICNQPAGSVVVWFLLVAGEANVATNAPTLTFTYDLAGPRPPTLTDISPGEASIQLEWTGSTSNDINGYRIYCEPADPNDIVPEEEAEGSTGGTGGTEASTTSAGAGDGVSGESSTPDNDSESTPPLENCRGITSLRAGEVPEGRFERGSTSQGTGRGTASNLSNFERYACGVAAYDDDGNVGVLSSMLCARPQPVLDYFEAYRAAGGEAGGGYCHFGRRPVSGFGLALGFGALGFAARRIRRSRSRARQEQP